MRVVIAGGHGQIALLLTARLHEARHEVAGIIRNPDHAHELESAGATPLVLDLERATTAELAVQLAGADAVVFAAGAGPNSGAERKDSVDRDAAVLLLHAAEQAGVPRYVMVSAMGADDYERDSDDVFQIYLRAKSEADAAVRASRLSWTVVRPGGLTDDPATGRVTVGESVGRGSIPRADVAAVLAACVVDDAAPGRQFELISGDLPIAEALRSLG